MKPLTPEDRDLLTRVLPLLTSPPVIQRVTDVLLTGEYLPTFPPFIEGVPTLDRRVDSVLWSPVFSDRSNETRLSLLRDKIEAAIPP